MNQKEIKRLRKIQNDRNFRAKVLMTISEFLMEFDFEEILDTDSLSKHQLNLLDEECDRTIDWLHDEAEKLLRKVH
jgi:hypothetical protein